MTTALVSLVGVPAQLRRSNRGTAQWRPRGNSPRCYEAIPGFARAHGMGSFSDQHHNLGVTRDLHWFEHCRGPLVVRKAAAGGGMILDGDPAEWLARVPDKLRERHISPDQWVLALSTCLSPTGLGRYLRLEHLHVARSMWQAMGDRMSTITSLAEDSY